eukprot:5382908-Amphidinium_carterae.1
MFRRCSDRDVVSRDGDAHVPMFSTHRLSDKSTVPEVNPCSQLILVIMASSATVGASKARSTPCFKEMAATS